MNKHELGERVSAAAVVGAPVAEAAGAPDFDPVRGEVDGAVEAGRVNERLDQQQRISETRRPATRQAARAPRGASTQGQAASGS